MHSNPGSMNAPFPPLSQTWNRLRAWLSNDYPELGDTLNYGMLPQDLAQIEMAFGFALPQAVRDSYLCADGQEAESAAGCSEGLFFGLTLLPLEDVLEEWRFWREVDDDPNTGANARLRDRMDSIPSGWVKREYSTRGWIPLVADKAGNYLGIDMNPGEGGAVGQVIVFGRDFDTKVVMFRGDGTHAWAKWLAGFVDDLESGEGYELGASADSDGSEDSVGYESYFFDGMGRGSGDGGGDAGTGGMRLAGEYKGWNVLEAWADRSVRKWQETGVIPTFEAQPLVNQVCAYFRLRDVVHLTLMLKGAQPIHDEALKVLSGDTSAAEVPIPVFTEASSSNTPLLQDESMVEPELLPIISVTKPPAPMPVDLPTADDILSVSDTAMSLQHDDLEAGGNIMMREVANALPAIRTNPPRSPTTPTTPTARIQVIPPPIPPPPASPSISLQKLTDPLQTPVQTSPMADLLADSNMSLADAAVPPMVPSTSEESSSTTSADSPVLISNEDTLPPTMASIRLVSSGESSATAVEESLSTDLVFVSKAETEASESPPVISEAEPQLQSRGRHDKKKSISAGLKKLGNMGGKRRPDSASSVKQVV